MTQMILSKVEHDIDNKILSLAGYARLLHVRDYLMYRLSRND